jgi:hypothetical protein
MRTKQNRNTVTHRTSNTAYEKIDTSKNGEKEYTDPKKKRKFRLDSHTVVLTNKTRKEFDEAYAELIKTKI